MIAAVGPVAVEPATVAPAVVVPAAAAEPAGIQTELEEAHHCWLLAVVQDVAGRLELQVLQSQVLEPQMHLLERAGQ